MSKHNVTQCNYQLQYCYLATQSTTRQQHHYTYNDTWKYTSVLLPDKDDTSRICKTSLSDSTEIYHTTSNLQTMLYVYELNYNKSIRILLDHYGRSHGQIFSLRNIQQIDDIMLPYTRKVIQCMSLLNKQQLQSLNVLILGLGGGILSDFISMYFHNATIDVIEYDTAIIDIAKNYFNATDNSDSNSNVTIINTDAYEYINQLVNNNTKTYDLIIQDIVFTPVDDIQTPMFSLNMYKTFYHLLNSNNGLLIHNLITNNHKILTHERLKSERTFEHTYTLSVHNYQHMLCSIRQEDRTIMKLTFYHVNQQWQQMIIDGHLPLWCKAVKPNQFDTEHGVVRS